MAYPENSFKVLLTKKLIDKNLKAVIKNNKHNITEAAYIYLYEEESLESNTKLKKLKEKQKQGSRKNKK